MAKNLLISRKSAFTLIEVLVAGSILFVVSAAVVGLSNSIIQGTAITTDEASANRLATQGLELITKIRDDQAKSGGFTDTGKFIWFAPVEDPAEYGWWQLSENPPSSNAWDLDLDDDFSNVIDTTVGEFNPDLAEAILLNDTAGANQITFYRFICIEALAAESNQEDGLLNCNTAKVNNNNLPVIDGTRDNPESCYSVEVGSTVNEDIYCQFTEESLNRNRVITGKIIPDGNAVKVRSVVIWQDRDIYRQTEISTILTNWQSITP